MKEGQRKQRKRKKSKETVDGKKSDKIKWTTTKCKSATKPEEIEEMSNKMKE